MPDPQPKNDKADKYTWCDSCDGYVLKTLLRTKAGIFADELTCPAGHEIKPDAPAPQA